MGRDEGDSEPCRDYTFWRRRVYGGMSIDEILGMIREDVADNPFGMESTPVGGGVPPNGYPVKEEEGVSDDVQNSTSSF